MFAEAALQGSDVHVLSATESIRPGSVMEQISGRLGEHLKDVTSVIDTSALFKGVSALSVACELLYAFAATPRDVVVFYDVDPKDGLQKTAVLRRQDVLNWGGNRLVYPHRTGFRRVSDQCHAGCTVHVTV